MKKYIFFSLLSVSLFLTFKFSTSDKVITLYDLNKAFNNNYINNKGEVCREKLKENISDLCFDELLKERDLVINPEKSISLLNYILDDPEILYRCHFLAHKVGGNIAKYITLDSILSLNYNNCNYGFQHGVLDILVKSEKPKIDEIIDLCNSKPPNSYLIGNCQHALGHIIVSFFTDLPNEAVKFCSNDLSGVCLSGVMMSFLQNYGNPFNYDNYFNNKNTVIETIYNLCKNNSNIYSIKCIETLPAFAIKYHPENLSFLIKICNGLDGKFKKACYRGVATSHFLVLDDEIDALVNNIYKVCNLDDADRDQCLIGLSLVLAVVNNRDTVNLDNLYCKKYFSKNDYELCNIGLLLFNNKEIPSSYSLID
jgi:hypothetical protein